MTMENKDIFISEIEAITENFEDPCPLDTVLSEKAYQFFQDLKDGKFETKTASKGGGSLTENGKAILAYMKETMDSCDNKFTSKEIGERMGISGRSVSGSIRSLCTGGYVEKISQTPVTYAITEKGISADV